jgi:hypothetical protein
LRELVDLLDPAYQIVGAWQRSGKQRCRDAQKRWLRAYINVGRSFGAVWLIGTPAPSLVLHPHLHPFKCRVFGNDPYRTIQSHCELICFSAIRFSTAHKRPNLKTLHLTALTSPLTSPPTSPSRVRGVMRDGCDKLTRLRGYRWGVAVGEPR